ncbi:MAG TPA: Crp/Fnr family transcriptional regulator [Burkholderiaceae bacterium]|nr:Crp/Fnr family transcriptional regulator [Burkholderiaceae bacterium]
MSAAQPPILCSTSRHTRMDAHHQPNGNGHIDARESRLVEGVLAALPLFAGLLPRELATVAREARALHLRRGSCVVRRAERMPGALSFAYGSAKLAVRRGDGDERVLRFLGRGDTFGIAETLAEAPCRGDLLTLADSCVIVVPQAPLLRLLDAHPHFARTLALSLCADVIDLGEELDASMQRNALRRLARYLMSLIGSASNGLAPVIQLPSTKAAIAARVGVTKETMSRMLRDLSERGLLEVAGSELTVKDRVRLAALAD